MLILMAAADLRFLLFPALLLVYYLVCWVRVGRDPGLENIAPLYEPPPGMSPAVARYIQTGGSDGTTLASVLAQLSAKGVIYIEPQSGAYRVELLQQETRVQPEEAALIQALFSQKMQAQPFSRSRTSEPGLSPVPEGLREAVKNLPLRQLASQGLAVAAELAAEPRKMAVIDPRSSVQIKLAIGAIQATFSKNLEGVYFRWNFIYVLLGMAGTFAFGLGASLLVESSRAPSTLLTLWLLLFTTIAGTAFAFARSARPTRPTAAQRAGTILMPVLFFGLPGFMVGVLAMPQARLFVLALLLAVVLNSVFMAWMRAPTERGVQELRHLAGFREFLTRVEQDRLERMNTPQEKAQLMTRYLPYAIALGVREGWGDTMAAAFSNAIVER